jgi:hypothetical protein
MVAAWGLYLAFGFMVTINESQSETCEIWQREIMGIPTNLQFKYGTSAKPGGYIQHI